MTLDTMTAAQRRETRRDLREAIEEIDADLESKLSDLAELKAEIAALREQRAWRAEAMRALKS